MHFDGSQGQFIKQSTLLMKYFFVKIFIDLPWFCTEGGKDRVPHAFLSSLPKHVLNTAGRAPASQTRELTPALRGARPSPQSEPRNQGVPGALSSPSPLSHEVSHTGFGASVEEATGGRWGGLRSGLGRAVCGMVAYGDVAKTGTKLGQG